jgi:hypothetical protein
MKEPGPLDPLFYLGVLIALFFLVTIMPLLFVYQLVSLAWVLARVAYEKAFLWFARAELGFSGVSLRSLDRAATRITAFTLAAALLGLLVLLVQLGMYLLSPAGRALVSR